MSIKDLAGLRPGQRRRATLAELNAIGFDTPVDSLPPTTLVEVVCNRSKEALTRFSLGLGPVLIPIVYVR